MGGLSEVKGRNCQPLVKLPTLTMWVTTRTRQMIAQRERDVWKASFVCIRIVFEQSQESKNKQHLQIQINLDCLIHGARCQKAQLMVVYWLILVNLSYVADCPRSRNEKSWNGPRKWFHNDFRLINLFLHIPGSWEPVYSNVWFPSCGNHEESNLTPLKQNRTSESWIKQNGNPTFSNSQLGENPGTVTPVREFRENGNPDGFKGHCGHFWNYFGRLGKNEIIFEFVGIFDICPLFMSNCPALQITLSMLHKLSDHFYSLSRISSRLSKPSKMIVRELFEIRRLLFQIVRKE